MADNKRWRLDLDFRDLPNPMLLMDGNPIDRSHFAVRFIDRKWIVYSRSDAFSREIGSCRASEIAPSIGGLSLPRDPSWYRFIDRTFLVRCGAGRDENWSIMFRLEIPADQWANPYTVTEFENALLEVVADRAEFKCVDPSRFFPDDIFKGASEGKGSGIRAYWTFGFAADIPDEWIDLEKEIQHWSQRFETHVEGASRNIMSDRKDSLVTFFDFPESVRAACEQYLVYFVQFLEDLGIRANSEIKQHAGSVMFSVAPRDGVTALTSIREALEVYLNFPFDSNFSGEAVALNDVAVTQLRANVLFLQSQLELARAVLQAKDAAIENLNLVVFQQRQFLTAGGVEMTHPSRWMLNKEDEEPLFGSSVSVTALEGKGFKVNLPYILRRLKRAFGGSRNR